MSRDFQSLPLSRRTHLDRRWLLISSVLALALLSAGCGGNSAATPSNVTMHTLTLNWSASSTPSVNYFVYRSSQSNGPFTRLNTSPTAATTYQDSVSGGQILYYCVTAVDANMTESIPSNTVQANVPQ